jgi:hypothetical protein
MAWHSADTLSGLDRYANVAPSRPARRDRSWPAWVLPTLALICGALVSAAFFTIGWRNQTEQNVAAQNALAAETARNHDLTERLAKARALVALDERVVTRARAAVRKAKAAAATVSVQSGTVQTNATSVSGTASTMASAAGRIAGELRTLSAYLTTTPITQLDAGYIKNQAAYLVRQVDALDAEGGTLTSSVAGFQGAIRKLEHLAAALSGRK